jgi:hypothetical protein
MFFSADFIQCSFVLSFSLLLLLIGTNPDFIVDNATCSHILVVSIAMIGFCVLSDCVIILSELITK